MAKKKKELEYKRSMQELSEKDRKVKADEKAKSSVANQLKFGANVKKFEPPPEPKG